MQVTVISGSPKGELSVTLQSLRFIEKKFSEHNFTYFHVGQIINVIEKKKEKQEEIINSVKNSDLIIFAQPVYALSIPAQLKRFIELIFSGDMKEAFKGKYAAVITTSINFFDHSAHAYMRAVLEDMGMLFLSSFSADSYDLLKEEEQGRLEYFAKDIFKGVETKRPVTKAFEPLRPSLWKYQEKTEAKLLDNSDKKVLIIQDRQYKDENAGLMAERIRSSFKSADHLIIENMHMAGGCLGCIQCGFDNKCVYTGKDDFIENYDKRVKKADIIFFVMKTEDRMFSSVWKAFFDRSFFNTHTPVFRGKQLAFVISGPLAQMAPFRETLYASGEWQGAGVIDIISDECEDSHLLDRLLDDLAERVLKASENAYIPPASFLGKAGMKVFRDDVFGRHRFVFQADHKWYEENGLYDFPHDDKRVIETNAFMFDLMKDPETKEAIRKMLKAEMVKPIAKVVDKL